LPIIGLISLVLESGLNLSVTLDGVICGVVGHVERLRYLVAVVNDICFGLLETLSDKISRL